MNSFSSATRWSVVFDAVVVVFVIVIVVVLITVTLVVVLSWGLAQPRIPQIIPLLWGDYHLRVERNPLSDGAISRGVHRQGFGELKRESITVASFAWQSTSEELEQTKSFSRTGRTRLCTTIRTIYDSEGSNYKQWQTGQSDTICATYEVYLDAATKLNS